MDRYSEVVPRAIDDLALSGHRAPVSRAVGRRVGASGMASAQFGTAPAWMARGAASRPVSVCCCTEYQVRPYGPMTTTSRDFSATSSAYIPRQIGRLATLRASVPRADRRERGDEDDQYARAGCLGRRQPRPAPSTTYGNNMVQCPQRTLRSKPTLKAPRE